jgi:hypothetical protein
VSDQLVELVMGVQAARVGQHPDRGRADGDGLLPGGRHLSVKGPPKGLDPQDGNDLRAKPFGLGMKPSGALPQLIYAQVRGPGRCPFHEIGDPVPICKKLALLSGREQPVREAGSMEGTPEPIAGLGEVVPHRTRVEPRVDPAEQDPQARGDDVRDRPALGGEELLPGGPYIPSSLSSQETISGVSS